VLEIWFGGRNNLEFVRSLGSNFHAIELCVAGLRIRSAENRIQTLSSDFVSALFAVHILLLVKLVPIYQTIGQILS
jgi:hypothetical protein